MRFDCNARRLYPIFQHPEKAIATSICGMPCKKFQLPWCSPTNTVRRVPFRITRTDEKNKNLRLVLSRSNLYSQARFKEFRKEHTNPPTEKRSSMEQGACHCYSPVMVRYKMPDCHAHRAERYQAGLPEGKRGRYAGLLGWGSQEKDRDHVNPRNVKQPSGRHCRIV